MAKEDKKEEIEIEDKAVEIDIVADCKGCGDREMKIPKDWEAYFVGKGWRLK